jgi:hypothetical protein
MLPAMPLANIKRRGASKARTVWSSNVRRSSNTAKTARDGRDGLPSASWTALAELRHPRPDPLPSPAEALDRPFSAFPSWFLRVTCDRCGKTTMLNEAHTKGKRREMTLRELLARMRHDGCGGLAGKAELLTGIEGVSPRVRKGLTAQ